VCERLNAAAGSDVAVVFPMDGFHYYRKQLDAMPDQEEARKRRGSPFTFDAEAFVARVRAAKLNGSNQPWLPTPTPTMVPAFDHEVHDPEEDAITILPSHKVILVEGNYLLLPEVGAVQAWFRDP
jgi:pantothenate kinase